MHVNFIKAFLEDNHLLAGQIIADLCLRNGEPVILKDGRSFTKLDTIPFKKLRIEDYAVKLETVLKTYSPEYLTIWAYPKLFGHQADKKEVIKLLNSKGFEVSLDRGERVYWRYPDGEKGQGDRITLVARYNRDTYTLSDDFLRTDDGQCWDACGNVRSIFSQIGSPLPVFQPTSNKHISELFQVLA